MAEHIHYDECATCEGTGKQDGLKCPDCDGTGQGSPIAQKLVGDCDLGASELADDGA